MKKLPTLLLTLSLLLTACGTDQPDNAATLPTPTGEVLVEAELRAADLPEICRVWFDIADTAGAAEKSGTSSRAARAEDGACGIVAVRLPDGSYTDLVREDDTFAEGMKLSEFSNGGAKRLSSYDQILWNGETYDACTIEAANCAIPNLSAPEGGILRLNIFGECTVDGGGTEYGCFEGFDCVLVTGSGTLTIVNTSGLDCGGKSLPLPALMLDGNMTLRCESIRLTPGGDAPALAVLGGDLCAEQLWLNGGELVNAGGSVLARNVFQASRAVLRGGTTLIDTLDSSAVFLLSGGAGHIADTLPAGSVVEGGAGTFSALDFSDAVIHDYSAGAVLWDGAEDSAPAASGAGYYSTAYSPDWAGAATNAIWDSLTLANPITDCWFAGTLTMENGSAPELPAWGGLHLKLRGENTIDGDLAGTGLLLTGGGSLRAGGINVWSWGGVHAPFLAVWEDCSVRCDALHMGSSASEEGILHLDGDLTVDGEFWLQNARLEIAAGELRLMGEASIERGDVIIYGGTVILEQGLWLGEGDIIITGRSEVIVPGGEAGLVTENGRVVLNGGTIREP